MKATQQIDAYGLAVWYGVVQQGMSTLHQHFEVEVNFIEQGAMTYLFGAHQYHIERGQLAVFWGATPHQLIDCEPNTHCYWATIPLAHLLEWNMPDPFTAQLVRGAPLYIEPSLEADLAQFQRWSRDWSAHNPEYRLIVLLEIQARLRRFALDYAALPMEQSATWGVNTMLHHKVIAMIQFISERYTEPLTSAEIAVHVDLHPKYALQLFKRTLGISLLTYLTQYRLAHAHRLLATTSLKVIDIALESGFGSLSRFYAVFRRTYGISPRRFRSAMLR